MAYKKKTRFLGCVIFSVTKKFYQEKRVLQDERKRGEELGSLRHLCISQTSQI